jgi:HSP20 family protein
MAEKKDVLTARPAARDPFVLLRQMTSELDKAFEQPFGAGLRLPTLRGFWGAPTADWAPTIDVFERDNRLVTRVDLPGLKKEDVRVEVTEGHLAISGERRNETEEKKENVYRCERSYGHFSRIVPLPDGVKVEDVKATFADGVLEVSVAFPARADLKPRTVAIEEAPTLAKDAAA